MSVNEKEVQKKNGLKGSNSPKFSLKIDSIRKESQTQDANEASSNITEDTTSNINRTNNPLGNLEEICEKENIYYNLANRTLLLLQDPNNQNHYLLNGFK